MSQSLNSIIDSNIVGGGCNGGQKTTASALRSVLKEMVAAIDEKPEKGDKGDIGPQGYQGKDGSQGKQGPRGEKGESGDKGDKGDRGFQGYQGYAGSDGKQGKQGSVGPQGAQGDQGPQGKDGSVSFADLSPEEVASLKGADGAQGYQGDLGPQGAQGFQGSDGAQGEQGPQGKDGSVSFSDLTPEQIATITGAQGPQGPAGSGEGGSGTQGVQGPSGESGQQGYQGPIGPQGVQGDKGAQGYQGPIGENGVGTQGYQGPKGADGNAADFVLSVGLNGSVLEFYRNGDLISEINISNLINEALCPSETEFNDSMNTSRNLNYSSLGSYAFVSAAFVSGSVTTTDGEVITITSDSPAETAFTYTISSGNENVKIRDIVDKFSFTSNGGNIRGGASDTDVHVTIKSTENLEGYITNVEAFYNLTFSNGSETKILSIKVSDNRDSTVGNLNSPITSGNYAHAYYDYQGNLLRCYYKNGNKVNCANYYIRQENLDDANRFLKHPFDNLLFSSEICRPRYGFDETYAYFDEDKVINSDDKFFFQFVQNSDASISDYFTREGRIYSNASHIADFTIFPSLFYHNISNGAVSEDLGNHIVITSDGEYYASSNDNNVDRIINNVPALRLKDTKLSNQGYVYEMFATYDNELSNAYGDDDFSANCIVFSGTPEFCKSRHVYNGASFSSTTVTSGYTAKRVYFIAGQDNNATFTYYKNVVGQATPTPLPNEEDLVDLREICKEPYIYQDYGAPGYWAVDIDDFDDYVFTGRTVNDRLCIKLTKQFMEARGFGGDRSPVFYYDLEPFVPNNIITRIGGNDDLSSFKTKGKHSIEIFNFLENILPNETENTKTAQIKIHWCGVDNSLCDSGFTSSNDNLLAIKTDNYFDYNKCVEKMDGEQTFYLYQLPQYGASNDFSTEDSMPSSDTIHISIDGEDANNIQPTVELSYAMPYFTPGWADSTRTIGLPFDDRTYSEIENDLLNDATKIATGFTDGTFVFQIVDSNLREYRQWLQEYARTAYYTSRLNNFLRDGIVSSEEEFKEKYMVYSYLVTFAPSNVSSNSIRDLSTKREKYIITVDALSSTATLSVRKL